MLSEGYSEKAIHMVSVVDGKYCLTPEAKKFLSSIPGPIGVVSVAGVYRTGKSYLLNRMLLNRNNGFNVGSTVNACTKGLWCWGTPIKGTSPNGEPVNIVIIDTEGINALDEESTHDVRVFTLAILASSCFIYNSMGSIDENAVQNLSLVTNLTKHIQLKASSSGQEVDPEEIGQYFPSFFWVVRDFSLQLVDPEGNSITSGDYLERALAPQKGTSEDAQEKNKIRRLLTGFFKERNCFTLIRPLVDETKLQNLDQLDFGELRAEFVDQVFKFRNKVIKNIKVKEINGQKLDGQMYSSMLDSYVTSINDGAVPNIENAWTYLCKEQSDKLLDECFQLYVRETKEKLAPVIPCIESKFNSIAEEAMEASYRLYREKAIGDDIENGFKHLKQVIKAEMQVQQKDNTETGKRLLTDYIRTQSQKLSKRLSTQIQTYKEYAEEVEKLHTQCLEEGPKVAFASSIILETLNKMVFQGGNYFFNKIMKEKVNLEKMSSVKEEQLLAEMQSIKGETTTDKKNLNGKITELDREKIEMSTKLQKLEFELEKIKKDKESEETQLGSKLVSKQSEFERVREDLETQLKTYTEKYDKENQENRRITNEQEKQKALFDLKVKQQQSEIDELRKKERLMDSEINFSKNELSTQLREAVAKHQKTITELEFSSRELSEQKFELTQALNNVKEELEEKSEKLEKKEKKFKEEIMTKNTELERLKKESEIERKKVNDEFERKVDNTSREQTEFKDSFTKQEQLIKQLQKQLKETRDRYSKETDVAKQQLQFAEEKLQHINILLEQTRKSHETAITTVQNEKGLEREELETHKINTLVIDHDREVMHIKDELELERKNSFTQIENLRKQNDQNELKLKIEIEKSGCLGLEKEEYERKSKSLAEELKNMKKQKESSQEIALMEKDGFYESKIRSLENEMEELKEKHEFEVRETQTKTENTITHIKNFYEVEKQNLETRLASEKDKYKKKLNDIYEECERKKQEEIEIIQDEKYRIEEELADLDETTKRIINDQQHEIDLKARDIVNLEKHIRDLKDLLNKKESEFSLKEETLTINLRTERDTSSKKIEELQSQANAREKEIMTLSHERNQLTSHLSKKEAHLAEVESELADWKTKSNSTIDSLRKQMGDKDKDFMDKKSHYEKSIALASQENEYFTKKVTELEAQLATALENHTLKLKTMKNDHSSELLVLSEKYVFEKNEMEDKLSKLKKSKKETEANYERRINEAERSSAIDTEKISNLDLKLRDLEEKRAYESSQLKTELEEVKRRYTSEAHTLSEQTKSLRSQISDLQSQKNEIATTLDREKTLFQNRLNFEMETKENYKREKEEAQHKLDTTIDSFHKNQMSQKTTFEISMKETQSKVESEYREKIRSLTDQLHTKSREYEALLKKLELDIKNLQEKLALEVQARRMLEETSSRKIEELTENEKRMSQELMKLKKEKDSLMMDHHRALEKEKENHKSRANFLEEKYRTLDVAKNDLYLESEKERARWNFEKESKEEKIDELSERLQKYERDTLRIQKENEKLRTERKSNKTHSFISKWGTSILEQKKTHREEEHSSAIRDGENKENLKLNMEDTN